MGLPWHMERGELGLGNKSGLSLGPGRGEH